MHDNLQIPYGICDFKRIRTEGYYYIDKTAYIPLLERSGSFLFFVRPRRFEFKGAELVCAKQIAEERM